MTPKSLRGRPRTSLAASKTPVEAAATPLLDRFPAEIKLQILRYVLVCPEHLSFAHEQFSSKKMPIELEDAWRLTHYSRVLRLCRWNHFEFDEPEAKALKSDFSAVCLVSKETRYNARNVFFARNRWVLHATSSFDAIKWVLKHWGGEALCKMTNVRIELQSTIGLGLCYNALKSFVNAVRCDHRLQDLSIQWISSSRPMNPLLHVHPTSAPHMIQVFRNTALEWNSCGGRGRKIESKVSIPSSMSQLDPDWATREVLLQPLQYLRGIKRARIEGTVTESWANYLEMAMTAATGAVVHEFDFQLEVKEALQKLVKEQSPLSTSLEPSNVQDKSQIW